MLGDPPPIPDDKTPENWSTFCKATRAAKRKFFDAKIEEIAKTN